MTVGVAASQSSGSTDSEYTSWTNTQVSGRQVVLQSGGDTVLQGAVIEGNTVKTDIGGDLIIKSLQDAASRRSSMRARR